VTFLPNVSSTLLFAAALSTGGVGLLLWRRRRIPGGKALAWMLFAVCGWATVAGLEAGATELPAKILFSKLEYVGSGSVALLLFTFALRHAGAGRWLTRRRLALLTTIPIANLALVFSNDWHRLVWTGFTAGPAGSHQIVYHHGPVFFAIVAALYAMILPATIVLARTALRETITHRRQALAILVASVAPWLGTLLYLLDLEALAGFNLVPMSFAATGLILSLSVIGLGHFDVVPIARSALVENMSDAILVLDASGAIVDANRSAGFLLSSSKRLVGRNAADALAPWPAILERCHGAEPCHSEALLGEQPLCYVDIRATPLRDADDRIHGRLIVLRDITSRYQAERELQRVNRRLQEQIVEIERLQVELRDQAIRDPLTNLFNRRYLEETLPREMARAGRAGAPLAVLLLDVDRFKEINDTDGHHAGDAALQSLGGLLATETRRGDIACRYGGDEFAIVLPNTTVDAAVERAEEIRSRFAAAKPARRITLSVGVASFPWDGRTEAEILRAADRALYAAKDSGRDCVRTA